MSKVARNAAAGSVCLFADFRYEFVSEMGVTIFVTIFVPIFVGPGLEGGNKIGTKKGTNTGTKIVTLISENRDAHFETSRGAPAGHLGSVHRVPAGAL